MLRVILKFKKAMVILIMGAILLGIRMGNINANQYYTEEDTVVALDYGHFWGEPGKRSPYDSFWDCQKLEIQYNLSVGRLVEQKIKEKRPDIKIYLTNPNGTDKTRGQRAVNSYNHKADILVSLHMNAIGDEWQSKINGTCICINKNSSALTKKLAQDFVDDYSEKTNIPKVCTNGIYERGNEVGILQKGTELGIPSFLIEMDFMDNYQVYRNFGDKEYIDMIADVISDNIIKIIDNGGF